MPQNQPARSGAVSPSSLPWVSVVVTNHNYARYLPPCLESVAAQTYDRIECIVVDDGSTDDSGTVLEDVRQAWTRDAIAIETNGEARGQYSAMRQGLRRARGQFVVFVDADDLLDPDFVATHVACHLSERVHVAMSTSDQWLIDKNGHLVGVNPREKFRPFHALPRAMVRETVLEDGFGAGDVPVEEIAADANQDGYWIWGTTSSMMFRRDVLDLVMSRDFGIRICADEYLANFAHAIGGTAVIRKVLGMYRRHGGNNFSNNAVLGGFVPLSRRSVSAGSDPKASIADCLVAEGETFAEALGERQFAAIVMRFCTVRRGWDLLRRTKVPAGQIASQTARRWILGLLSWATGIRREVSWLFHRQPTYW